MENKEEFVPIPGYNGYEINIYGQVRRLDHSMKKSNGIAYSYKGRSITQSKVDGYYYVKINPNNRTKKVHRLLAITFIPNPNNHPCVNHINGIKTDNIIENLEWCTASHNIVHAFDIGLKTASQRKVQNINTGQIWTSVKHCSIELNIDYGRLFKDINKNQKYSIKYL